MFYGSELFFGGTLNPKVEGSIPSWPINLSGDLAGTLPVKSRHPDGDFAGDLTGRPPQHLP